LADNAAQPRPRVTKNQGDVLITRGGEERVTVRDHSVYQIITERVIALLEQGTIPWQKPWNGADLAPQNLVSRKPYRGVNVFLLHAMSYSSPYWLTFKQAQELGGHVRKGEHACPVVFWKWLDVERDRESERVPFLRYYSVFNVAQCEGLDGHVPAVPGTNGSAHKPIAEAERIVASMPKRPEIRQGLERAGFKPGHRVQVELTAEGVLTLRFVATEQPTP
jgi:antirestriction protein ArdC